ncbi:two-component system NarL family sensor kinase [Chryseobacterium sp. H1D6B]|uniref:ATP-binding protein n=1 Tax=Chryseobacterium sp. H1D6B TaxID=2940588 RepID=UPI0015CAFD94|nr:ATP-binding protein [Chryseobacterium sp. H1D6B]MDH6252921.1 two-component system NarL family sensor kinase [Chryseobacterium sp. H1D6B]
MKRLITLLCILGSFSLQSQQIIPLNEKPYEDSLQNVINHNINNSSKADAYFLLSNYYRNTDSVLSKKYLESGRILGKNTSFTTAKYYYYEGQYNLDRNKNKAASSYQKAIQALSKFKTEESDIFQALAWFNYGVTQKNKEGYPFLVKIILEKSIPLIQKYENSRHLGFMYSQLAIVLTYNAEFQKADIYNNKAINILEKNAPRSSELFFAYLNMASNFYYQAKGSIGKKYLDKAEKLIRPFPNSSSNAMYYYNSALYLITKQKNAEALPVIEKGLFFAEKFNMNLLAQMFYLNKYDILRKLKKYTEAKNLLEHILAEKTLIIDANNRKTIYLQLSSLNEEMGNTKDALGWERKYSKLNDSLNSENVKLEINTLETKFNTAEKERKIANLNTEKAQKELDINKKNQYLWLLGFASIFFLVLLVFIFFYNKKLNRQRKINIQQKLKELQQKEELKITKAVLESEERERERIARDLHDGLGGMLAGVKINLSTWSSTHLDHNGNQDFNKILNKLDNSVSELRHVARNLMPESLLNFGLETALRDLCEFYTRKDLDIDLQTLNIGKDLPLSVQINIYRIIQELLANAVKHSQAANILLQCSQSDENFFITIEDNGKGFKENSDKQHKSMGLDNLRNRVDYLKGNMEINSDQDGTTITIELNTHGIS